MRIHNIGPMSWAKMLSTTGRWRWPNWLEATRAQQRYGFTLGSDGDQIAQMYAQIPIVAASDATVAIVEPGRNDLDDGGMTDVIWTDRAKALLLAYRSGCPNLQRIAMVELWERDAISNAVGTYPKDSIPRLNAIMEPWCATNGFDWIPIRATMIDPASGANRNPYPGYVRPDGVHYATLGAYAAGKVYKTYLDGITASAVGYDSTTAGNLTANGTMAGTDGTLAGGVTGQAPDSLTVTRSAAAVASVASAVIVKDGRRWLELTIDTNPIAAGAGERVDIDVPNMAVTSNAWYAGRARVEVEATDGLTGVNLAFGSAPPSGTTRNSSIMQPTNDGGSGTSSNTALPMPREAWAGTLDGRSAPLQIQSNAVVGTMSLNLRYVKATDVGGIIKVRIADLDFRAITDPNALIGAIPTIAPAQTVQSGAPFSVPLAVNPSSRAVTYTLTGADAGQFAVVNGNLTMAAKDFNAPVDVGANNVYDVNVVATDLFGRVIARPTAVSVTSALTWQRVGRSIAFAAANTDTAELTIAEPVGTAQGDLVVIDVCHQDLTSIAAPAGLTKVAEVLNGNASAGSTSAQRSATTFYYVRGAAAPALAIGAGATGKGIHATTYRRNAQADVLDTFVSAFNAAAGVTLAAPSLTTAGPNELLHAFMAYGRVGNNSGMVATTDPATPSGTTASGTSGEPVVGAWTEIYDNTQSGAGIMVANAVKAAAGPTGALSVTFGNSSRQSMIVTAFKRAA
jgi:hypothetical protein